MVSRREEPRLATRVRPNRILIAPMEVAGFGARMGAGLESRGWKVDQVNLWQHPHGYGKEESPTWSVRIAQRILRLGLDHGRVAHRVLRLVAAPWLLWFVLVRARHYTAVVYLSGATLLFGLDRWIFRLRRVRLVCVYLGSDSRPVYMANPGNRDDEPDWPRQLRRMVRRQFKYVRATERAVDVVVCSPASGQFLSRPFVNWFAVGMPAPPRPRTAGNRESGTSATGADSPTKIVHAPSRPELKGTAEILAALGECDDGIDVVVLNGASADEVQRALLEADLAIDQLYADSPMAGFATEASQLGIPVLTFGYAAEFLRPFLDALGVPQGHYFPPDQLIPALQRALRDRAWREGLGRASTEYALAHLSAEEVAARFERVLLGDIPDDWWVRPPQCSYMWGSGLSKEACRRQILSLVDRYGKGSLLLEEIDSKSLHDALGACEPTASSAVE